VSIWRSIWRNERHPIYGAFIVNNPHVLGSKFGLNVCARSNGNKIVASAYIFTGFASGRIFPQLTASSGRAPLSLPSNSCAVFMLIEKSAPLRIKFALLMWC
jgi:hypothetical protein